MASPQWVYTSRLGQNGCHFQQYFLKRKVLYLIQIWVVIFLSGSLIDNDSSLVQLTVWLVPSRCQVITWYHVNLVAWCHMVSHGHNVLVNKKTKRNYVDDKTKFDMRREILFQVSSDMRGITGIGNKIKGLVMIRHQAITWHSSALASIRHWTISCCFCCFLLCFVYI